MIPVRASRTLPKTSRLVLASDIQFCEANGRLAGILDPPAQGAISNLAFAGKNLDWLHVSEGGELFRRSTKVIGAAAGAPAKPPQPPL
jgi:hypothetical protein